MRTEKDNTHFSDDENSESVDDGTVVVISQRSRSDCIPEVVGEQALQSERETWSASLFPGCSLACRCGHGLYANRLESTGLYGRRRRPIPSRRLM